MSAAEQNTVTITEPGVYDIPFDVYLADPVPGGSLSNSGAKTLLATCPAIFAYEREHGRPDTAAFDFGHAAHTEVLGDGVEIVVVDGEWRTKAAKEEVAAARERGATPLHREDYDKVQGMAAALVAHPVAGPLLTPGRGKVEQSAFWIDDQSGIWRRARYDFMTEEAERLVIVDYKSADDLTDRVLANAIGRYGYDQQHAWYCDGAKALGLDDDPRFLFVFQAKVPPYLVRVIELPERWVQYGRDKARRAIDLYARCREADDWPGYPYEIETLDPPAWVEYEQEDMVI